MNFEIDAIVEIPYGSMYKYEVDKETGILSVDRPLPYALPYNYGYVPGTLHGDGDPLDVCILGVYPVYPMTKVKVILLGALKCIDNGASDDKLLATIVGEPIGTSMANSLIESVKNYLSIYKQGFVVEEQVSAEEAYKILMKDVDAYLHG